MMHLPFGGRSGWGEPAGVSPLSRGALVAAVAVAMGLGAGPMARADGVVTGCTDQALRTALSNGGVVTFASDCSIIVTAPIALNNVSTTLDAAGHTVSISGGGSNQIFNVTGAFTLRGITLVSGKSDSGGAVQVQTNGTFVAEGCTFQGNVAAGTNGVAGADGKDSAFGQAGDGGSGTAGAPGRGGAIFNLGTVVLTSCTLITNSATGGNGGAGGAGGDGGGTLGQAGDGGNGGAGGVALGGAIYNAGELAVVSTTLRGNQVSAGDGGAKGAAGTGPFVGRAGRGGAGGAANGGAVYNARNIRAWRSLFSANSVMAGDSAAGGTQSNLDGQNGYNGGEAGGGGLCNVSTAAVTNCTFYGNSVRGGNGGNGGDGIGTLPTAGDGGNGGNGVGGGMQSGAPLYLVTCTVVSNSVYGGTNGVAGSGTFAGRNGSPGSPLGGNIAGGSGGTILLGTLIGPASKGIPGSGTFTDWGYNICADNSITLGTDSYPNATPLNLGSLSDNGGPTLTVALLTNSVALDKLPASLGPAEDQRGVPRPLPLNGTSDIGAFESSLSSPPIIFAQPADTNTTIGVAATMRVGAVGAAVLSYQWRLLGAPLSGATTSAYTVASPGTTNQGPYDVVITNSLGSVTSSVAYVHFVPAITTQPASVVVTAGTNVTFNVVAQGDPLLNYQWRLNGTEITGATGSSLTLSNVQVAHIGPYTVIVSNNYGSTLSAAATLNLRPSIITQPVGQAVSPGDAVALTVTATGSPSLTYQWRLNGAIIPGATSSVLAFASVQFTNSGIYSVLVGNTYGSAASSNATVAVTLPVSGWVREETNGLPGALLTVTPGPVYGAVLTDENGAFRFALGQGVFTVTPSLAGYGFVPASITVTVPPGASNLVFTARPLLSLASLTNGTVLLTGGGLTSLTYTVEAGSNLVDWLPLTNLPGPIRFAEPGPTNRVNRYYRVTR